MYNSASAGTHLSEVSVFFIGDWQVSPFTNILRRGNNIHSIEPKAMDVLLCLCSSPSKVISGNEILDQCWDTVAIGDNPVHKAINQLRKAMGDSPKQPRYIETIRKRGYRIIAELDFPLDGALKPDNKRWQGVSPFPGLMAFEPKDAAMFFGRQRSTAELLGRLSSQIDVGHGFCLILGPSGTGKSSLVNAGLLPVLMAPNGFDGIFVESYTAIDFADISGGRLFIDLALAMLDWEVNDQPIFADMSAEDLAAQLQQDVGPVLGQCQRVIDNCNSGHNKSWFLLFVDRLEVLLSSSVFNDSERANFVSLIEKFSASETIIVVVACRNDFYPLLVNYLSLMKNKDSGAHFDLAPPSRTELMQMICLPAKAANLSWSIDVDSSMPLDQLLCADAVDNADALPMLQYTLQELYLGRSDSGELKSSLYKALGGIEGAIGQRAEEIYQQLADSQQQQLPFILSRLVTLSREGDAVTSRAARWAEITHSSGRRFIEIMVDNRLFVSHLQNGDACFSLAHEALLRRWVRAAGWISSHKESLAVKSRLQQLSEVWLQEGRSSEYLLAPGKPLDEVLKLQHMPGFILDDDELALIKASQNRVRSKRRLATATTLLLCMLTLIALLTSVKSQQAENVAQQKRLEAENLLGFMVGEFADKLRSLKRMDLLDGISTEAIAYFSQPDHHQEESLIGSFFQSKLNFKSNLQHAQTLNAMGEVAYSRAKTEQAQHAFTSAKTILDKLYSEQTNNLELLKTLGANAFWLGRLATNEAAFIKAEGFFGLYLEYSQAMVAHDSGNQDAQLELSYAYLAMGSVSTKLQRQDAAKVAFEKALAIQYDLAKTVAPDHLSRADIADTLEWLAETEEQRGELQKAQQTREEVQAILGTLLSRHSGNGYLLEAQAYSHFNHANNLYYLTDYRASYQAIVSSIAYFEAILDQDPANQVWQSQLMSATAFQDYLATIGRIESSKPATSLDDFKLILEGVEKSSSVLAMIIRNYQVNEQWHLAQQAINLAIPRIEKLLAKPSNNHKLIATLANLFLAQAAQVTGSNVSGSDQTKFDACQQAITTIQPVVSLSSSYGLLLPYVRAYDCLGRLNEVQPYVDRLAKMQITNYQFDNHNHNQNQWSYYVSENK